MIITSITSGMGNQMFQYAAGLGLAVRRRTRLVLDTDFYLTNPYRRYELDRLAIEARPLGRLDRLRVRVSRPGVRPRLRGRVLRRVAPVRRLRFATERDAGFDPAVLDLPDRTVLSGYWQSEGYFAHCPDDVRRQFRFRHPPDRLNAEVLADIARGPSVCVHVRRGDYLNPAEVLGPAGLDYYRRAIPWMADRVPAARFFVFGDDPTWARAHLPVPPAAVFVTHNLGTNDPEDLRLMAACDHFVLANSTFSWWAAWLGERPTTHVVTPARWFKGDHPNERDIVPARWARL